MCRRGESGADADCLGDEAAASGDDHQRDRSTDAARGGEMKRRGRGQQHHAGDGEWESPAAGERESDLHPDGRGEKNPRERDEVVTVG